MQNNPPVRPPDRKERWVIRGLILIGLLSVAHFLYWFSRPEFVGHPVLFGMLAVVFGYGMLRHLYLWYHYLAISVPKRPKQVPRLTVDILTTYFPGEPRDMVENTLRAIRNIEYPHTAYLCDEGDDAYLKEVCRELGVHHVTRDNRKDAKAGNINNALRQASGDCCLILDPDHVPEPGILDHVMPHFSDPRVGFVQIVQSYYNKDASLVALGAAEQTYQFYGPMMMTMNSYGTVNAIGANCTFRRAALDDIGGHAPGLAEDMHTSMRLHAKGWKSVYVPRVLARGLVPETLPTYFKQQLKWSRGTFELLFRVYPALFRKFSWRQKFHYGLLPLHYLIGLIYLLSFLIPVLSLLFSITPWTGNLIVFLLALLPVSLSTILIRAYIQKWVIEQHERGFHLYGGLLQITAWWVHLLGFVYAIFNKKVPYIPTPKDEEQVANLRIVLPNILIGVLSVFAIVYGLRRDFNPFSLVMACFAGINALFMAFSVYLATSPLHIKEIVRKSGQQRVKGFLARMRHQYRKFSLWLFLLARRIALPALLFSCLLFGFYMDRYLEGQWEGITREEFLEWENESYYGIFNPSHPGGITDLSEVRDLEGRLNQRFDIVSLYLPWGDTPDIQYPDSLIQNIYQRGAWPMITWEPWMNSFMRADTIPEMYENRRVFEHITRGEFDAYIDGFARNLKSTGSPVFLRFAHEFDNPAYPWSESGGNTADAFIHAWRYVYRRFTALGAHNVIWVWNPFRAANVEAYFPGEDYVDWIGVTGLNYGKLNQDGQWHPFKSLYLPYREAFGKLPRLPVMIAEFGSLAEGGDREEWLVEALTDGRKEFEEIRAWVFFNSRWDSNIPAGASHPDPYLDWVADPGAFAFHREGHGGTEMHGTSKLRPAGTYDPVGLPTEPIRGIQYKKGQNWYGSYYVLDRLTLEKDFRMMKEAGINTIRIQDPSVYSHNLLTIAEAEGLGLIYSFWVPDEMDFLTDTAELEAIRQHILQVVKRHRDRKNIVAWNIGNPVWSAMRHRYARPDLDRQQRAYLQWLAALCSDIKEQDPGRLLFADFEPSGGYLSFLESIRSMGMRLDALGLVVNDMEQAHEFDQWARAAGLPYYIADMEVADLDALPGKHRVIRSWQDQWKVDQVSFDGLLDHTGRKRRAYYRLANAWKGTPIQEVSGSIGILRPAVSITPGKNVEYKAQRYLEGTWMEPEEAEANNYEWFLVKLGYFQEPIGLKHLGRGSTIRIEIPEDHEHYELMLTYGNTPSGSPVKSVRKRLNLPLQGS